MSIISLHSIYLITVVSTAALLVYSCMNKYHEKPQLNEELDKPSKLFFEGLYEGFNFTSNPQTINKINRFNVNLTKLDEAFVVLGQSMIYPEKQPEAVKLIYGFFDELKDNVKPSDKEGQQIIDQHLSVFQSVQTFQKLALKSLSEKQISPLLYYWDAQDLFPYGLYKEYGINLAYTLKLMIFDV